MKEITEKYANSMTEDLIKLINIPTVNGTPGEGEPFGQQIAKGLDCVLQIGNKFGFKTKNYDGYAGEITAKSGSKTIGILCHVDVVDAGFGWSTSPFEAKIIEGKIYGRGAIDDKGPMVACLYAMKYLADNEKLPEDTAVRMIIGTDEETGWRGIEHYTKIQSCPDASFTPDGNFPLICGEKGVYSFNLTYSLDKSTENKAKIKIISMEGGVAGNSVPSHATCTLKCESKYVGRAKKKIESYIAEIECKAEVEVFGDDIIINVDGKGAHAMSPEKGENAISHLLNILGVYDRDELQEYKLIEAYNQYIGMDYYGKLFGCAECDSESGCLTFNVGKMKTIDESNFEFTINLRYPVTASFDKLSAAILKTCQEAGFSYSMTSHLPPVYFNKKGKLISALLNSYQSVTGDEISQPITIGGATYSRAMPNTVAFGPVFPWEEELAHEADECISIESLIKMTEIYARAILALADAIK